MNRINDILLWVFMASLALFAVVFSLYVASILIPILLVIVVASGLANLIIFLYKNYKSKSTEKCRINVRTRKNKPEIIDAEYEIVDEKK